jgi:hypothetical protein
LPASYGSNAQRAMNPAPGKGTMKEDICQDIQRKGSAPGRNFQPLSPALSRPQYASFEGKIQNSSVVFIRIKYIFILVLQTELCKFLLSPNPFPA